MDNSNFFDVVPITTKEQLTRLCEIYIIDEPILTALNVSKQDWMSFADCDLSSCIGNGHSFIAMDKATQEIIGGITCDEWLSPKVYPLDYCEGIRIMMDSVGCMIEKVLNATIPGTDPWMGTKYGIGICCVAPQHRNKGIIGILMKRLMHSFQEGDAITISTSSEYSYKATMRKGGVVMAELDYATWQWGGRFPLATVSLPHKKARLLYFVVKHTNT
jgi:hypothetical protein